MDAATVGVGKQLEPRRLVGIALVAFAVAGGMFLSRVLAAAFDGLKWDDSLIFGVEHLSTLLGFLVATAAAVVAWLHPRVHAGSMEIAAELKRVTWPSVAETRVSTVAVIIATVVCSVVLFVFDLMASKVMTVWLPHAMSWIAKL